MVFPETLSLTGDPSSSLLSGLSYAASWEPPSAYPLAFTPNPDDQEMKKPVLHLLSIIILGLDSSSG